MRYITPLLIVILSLTTATLTAQRKPSIDNYNSTIGYDLTGGRKYVEIPFENYNNLVVVAVTVNNIIPLKFIVDTGVSSAILTDSKLGRMLRLNYDRKITVYGADRTRELEAFVATQVVLSMPGVQGKGQAMLVLKEDYLELEKHLGTQVHGILGYDLFSRFVVKLDYDKNIMTLYEPDYFRAPRVYKPYPIEIEDTKPYLKASLGLKNGNSYDSARLLIDTGASFALMLEMGMDTTITVPEKNIIGNLGRGLGGEMVGYYARANTFNLGKYKFRNYIASFNPQENMTPFVEETERLGAVGGEILNRFTIIFDYFRKRVYLKKGYNYRSAFELNMSGIELIALTDNKGQHFVIKSIVEDSPAHKAGLQPGDEIIRIDGLNASGRTLNNFFEAFRRKNGKKMRLRVLRGNQKRKYIFRLKRRI